jgi:AraC-like DNA-binding protein
MKVYSTLDTISREPERFVQFLKTLYVLYELSVADDAKSLASGTFSYSEKESESGRIQKVKQYVSEHFSESLKLSDLAELVGMSPVSFSRFFHQRTGRTLSEYIVDVRLGHAARMLVDSSMNVSEICYACGFNNLSNFNRIFKSRRNCTPREFRSMYKKNKVLV